MAFAGLVVLAGWWDWRTLTIPNAIPAAILAVFAGWAAGAWTAGAVQPHALMLALMASSAVSLLAVLAFAGGVVGGGDAKLLAASSLFAGLPLMMDFLAVTALAGGLLGLAALLTPARIAALGGGGDAAPARRGRRVAYGPAIAGASLWVVAMLAGS
ncbi:prepilin peptidase [Reyranella sp.]|uniref:prepilin peptidase n=1 Tax=Reyranella sp. TaxID=1929291 RepID=UPI003BA96BD7